MTKKVLDLIQYIRVILQTEQKIILMCETKQAIPVARKLPETRSAKNHKFNIAGYEGYITVGLYEDGTPGELFITMDEQGSTVGGLLDTIGSMTSIALQYGVPLEVMVRRFAFRRFEPSGFTRNPEIRSATSIVDYVFRWMGREFIPGLSEESLRGEGELVLPTVISGK